jgi:hypothetical protein
MKYTIANGSSECILINVSSTPCIFICMEILYVESWLSVFGHTGSISVCCVGTVYSRSHCVRLSYPSHGHPSLTAEYLQLFLYPQLNIPPRSSSAYFLQFPLLASFRHKFMYSVFVPKGKMSREFQILHPPVS